MTDQELLDTLRNAITALGLGQCAPEELVAEARASSSRREEARRLLSDARARIKELESALRDLGANPDGDLQGEVRAISNRAAGDSAAAQHDLDCALRDLAAKDATIAEVRAHFSGLGQRIAELERDLAAKDDARSDAIRMAHAAAKISADLAAAEITAALADAGAPRAYRIDDDTERPIPDPERIRLLGERVHALRAQIREVTDATNYLDALIEAHGALDALSAPRLADGCVLSLAARIRSIPR